jgi:hypothetical protein
MHVSLSLPTHMVWGPEHEASLLSTYTTELFAEHNNTMRQSQVAACMTSFGNTGRINAKVERSTDVVTRGLDRLWLNTQSLAML